MADELPAYWAMAETYLWPAKDRRVPWRDLVMRAKTDPTWPWMPGARGLEVLRDEALKQGWRVEPDRLEFWQGQPSRMHDRVVYTTPGGVPGLLAQASDWQRVRLAP